VPDVTRSGPQAVLILLIGLALAAGSGWNALGSPRWTQQLPGLLIGLSLMSFGWSSWARSRRAARD
jgi:hypothetical protein